MKPSIATTLSIIGVAATGAFAFVVNTSVLHNATTSSESAQSLQSEMVALGVTGEVSATPGAVVNAAAAPQDQTTAPSATVPIATAPVAPAPTQSQYNIDGIGTVTLEQNVASLAVASVNPVAGYTYSMSAVSNTRIAVKFEKDGAGMTFNAELLDSRIVTSLVAHAAPPIAAPANHGSPGDDEHEGEDEHEGDDEHEGEDDD